MKRQNTVIYICVIITLLNVAGLLFIACKSFYSGSILNFRLL